MMRLGRLALGLALSVSVSACGSTPEERGLSGIGLGAAGGAVLGAITGLTLVEGVIIGAAAGGLTGAFTDESTLNLGPPLWRRGGTASARETRTNGVASAPNLVSDVQRDLAALGYQPGPIDGAMGPRTAAAIREYQRDHGLAVDGRPSLALAHHLDGRSAQVAQKTGVR